METLVTGPGRSQPKQRRQRAFAHGARSAFDISGLASFHDEVFRPRALKPAGPAESIARDLAGVMDRFGRSAALGRRAHEAGLKIEDLEPGRTTSGDALESREVPLSHTRSSRGTAVKSTD